MSDENNAAPDPINQAVKAAGLDANELGEHFVEHGELAAEHYERLQDAG